MKKLEYKELKKEHLKDFFNKVLSGDYDLMIRAGIYSYFFTHYYVDEFDYDGKKEEIIEDCSKERYNYEDFEKLFNGAVKFEKYIIDEENNFIVVVSSKSERRY